MSKMARTKLDTGAPPGRIQGSGHPAGPFHVGVSFSKLLTTTSGKLISSILVVSPVLFVGHQGG